MRKTVGDRVMYSVGTDVCIWSGMDGFGRYLWREAEMPDEDGVCVFDLKEVGHKL